jgi:hypothetical protein
MFGVEKAAALGTLGRVRGALTRRLLDTPENAVARAVSRLAYSTALCPDTRSSVRWATSELLRRGHMLLE